MRTHHGGSTVSRWVASAGLAALVVALVPTTTQATNTVPYADSFEGYAAGTGLVDSNNWYGLIGTGLVVRTMPNTYPLRMPLPSATHSNVLELVEPATNLLNHAGGDTNIWIDCVVYPVRSATEPEVDSDIQLALYFNSNGHVVVRHRYYTAGYAYPVRWTELDHPSLPTDRWVRVTIKLDYLTTYYPQYEVTDKFFQIYLNGGSAITNQYGLTHIPFDPDAGPPPMGGSWFMLANGGNGNGPAKISSLALQGTGFLDDLVVTNGDPLVAAPNTWTIEATVGTGGSIYPGGMLTVDEGQDLTFTIYAFDNYFLADVLVDGVSVGATNSYTFNTITTNHTIAASFTYTGPLYTSKGVNQSWMDLHGLTDYEVDQDLDPDGDGALTWEEYVAGTDPTNSASVFRVIDVSYLGSQNRVRWYGTTDSGVTKPFSMLRSTNLTASATNAWELIESNSLPRDASGTNVYWDVNVPSNAPAYYRPTVLWNL